VTFQELYNIMLAFGVALTAIGVWMVYGVAWGMITGGVLIILLTVYAGHLVMRRSHNKEG
jgi:heme/copper-type cytochrome/quinol oxidase subunit 4